MSVRIPIGIKPFSFFYGCEAILLLEVEIPSLRVTLHDILLDEAYQVTHLEKLELLEKHQRATHEHPIIKTLQQKGQTLCFSNK